MPTGTECYRVLNRNVHQIECQPIKKTITGFFYRVFFIEIRWKWSACSIFRLPSFESKCSPKSHRYWVFYRVFLCIKQNHISALQCLRCSGSSTYRGLHFSLIIAFFLLASFGNGGRHLFFFCFLSALSPAAAAAHWLSWPSSSSFFLSGSIFSLYSLFSSSFSSRLPSGLPSRLPSFKSKKSRLPRGRSWLGSRDDFFLPSRLPSRLQK